MNRAERRALEKDPLRKHKHEVADEICNDFMSAVLTEIKEEKDITEEKYFEIFDSYNEDWKNVCRIYATNFKPEWFTMMFKNGYLKVKKSGYFDGILEQIDKVFDVYLDSKKPRRPYVNPNRIRMSKKERRKRRQELKKKTTEESNE